MLNASSSRDGTEADQVRHYTAAAGTCFGTRKHSMRAAREDHARTSSRISPGSLQDLLTRTCARSCTDLLARISKASPPKCQEGCAGFIAFLLRSTKCCPRPFTLTTPRRRLCARLRNRNAHGHLTRTLLCENVERRAKLSMINNSTLSETKPLVILHGGPQSDGKEWTFWGCQLADISQNWPNFAKYLIILVGSIHF